MWYDKPITKSMALELFDELYDLTTESVINYAPELRDLWPLSLDTPLNYMYNPRGAIINISRTTSMWNAIELVTRKVYGTHFIIMSRSHLGKKSNMYPLSSQLPTFVAAPYKITQLVQHSGYISNLTYGIDLRSVGKLRLHRYMETPMPLTEIEAQDPKHFLYDSENDAKTAMKLCHFDMWRQTFRGPVYRFNNMCYEQPTTDQIKTLIIILRALHVVTEGGLLQDLVVPGSCIHNTEHVFPGIPWDTIRNYISNDYKLDHQNPDHWYNLLFAETKRCDYEYQDLPYSDEGTIASQLDFARWRSEFNDGRLERLIDDDYYYTESHLKGLQRRIRDYGYSAQSPEDTNTSLRLYAIANHIEDAESVYMHLFENLL
jgi:hypothetical protein